MSVLCSYKHFVIDTAKLKTLLDSQRPRCNFNSVFLVQVFKHGR